MRLLYSLAWWLALPLVLGRLWLRGRREPGYRQHLGERFGFYTPGPAAPLLWVHAVSVGETRAAEPLIDALLAAYPGHAILLTHMTPTGRATGAALYGKHGERLRQCYLPYDTGWMVGRFLRHFKPVICILMETEVWPNVMAQCRRHRVPVALVNARLSERSLAKAQRLSALMGEAARAMSCVAAQTEADAERLRSLGAPRVAVTGSVKFDVTPPPPAIDKGLAMRALIGARPVFLCASTREGEESLILDAWRKAGADHALLLIVPRHPQRFDEVARMAQERGLRLARRSAMDDRPIDDMVQVLLGDSMGEMFAYYAACDLAFIGGSLLPLGGQNLIEACAVGKPVLIGPHTFNFAAVSEDAVAAGAALRAADADAMVQEAHRLLGAAQQREAMGGRALAFARQHRGATERTMRLLRDLI
ncbi:lipid IV(A) 3-deoxy-D-manno-octulosonic acid transferase [Noviherbaspirillum sp. CPCC 100848]|uniref:3-deoxy-D-manno-octulosonic acid transferase n=1 Tax=Noviherbaspirillum album TaxID=3080276 RepID=A0ABU6JHH0_9BURK|nr:lipid IV(A) 3-deoxy-D-manno-octulosonic acid transferase [Noviherbaspirillum sp. CPCC 100848]MEC4722985.1 lipid IV(A) 3-deoxy-D-manno-octulosonic acid transferase [Noviherbaspirillum sp. CPCC 100848]